MLSQNLAILIAVLFQSCAARPTLTPAQDEETTEDVAFFNKTLVDRDALIDRYAPIGRDALVGRDDTKPLTPIEKGMLDDQQNAYRGIYWYTAYPGGEAPRGESGDGGCLVWQYNILVEATRNAVRLASFHGSDLIMEDRSFNKFFVRNSVAPIGGRWTSSKGVQEAYTAIRHNMLQPSRFPLDGIGRRRRRDRITYQCKDTALPVGSKGCAGGAAAYTTDPSINGFGWTVVFCPKFFDDLKYLNPILDRPNVPESSLGSLDLVSYEQVILHEWLHNDIMGFSQHLTDVVDQIDDNGPRRKVYGMSEARDYAWKFMRGVKMNINPKIVANVENYVWYFVDKMYGSQWGWSGTGDSYPLSDLGEIGSGDDDGFFPLLASALDLGLETEQTDAADLPVPTRPDSCHGDLEIDTEDTSGLICDYTNPPNPDDLLPAASIAGSLLGDLLDPSPDTTVV